LSALSFEAVKVRITQNKQGVYLVLSVHPDEVPEDLLRSWVGTRYYCAMVGIQDDETPAPHKPITKKSHGQKFVDRAGIMAREKEFWKFSEVDNEADASEFIRNFCNIHSRSELKNNEFAQILFENINDKYNQWYEKNGKQ
jgi:hypothetical protein